MNRATRSMQGLHAVIVACLLLFVTGCERLSESEGIKPEVPPSEARPSAPAQLGGTEAESVEAGAAGSAEAKPEYRIYRGSGRFVRGKSDTPATIQVGPGGDITLDFADADIRQVIQATLGDIMGLNYVIAPDVQGTVTAQTERPISRDALLPTLESILRLHGVALVLDGAVYRVETLQGAARGPRAVRLGAGPSGAGYGVQVVQLRYIGAENMRTTLGPLAGDSAVLHADRTRNLLIIAGSQPELRTLMDAVRIFDVDWLSGMSFGIFPLSNVEPKTVIGELEVILDAERGGALADLVRFVPIERLNAVLAIAKQPRYLDGIRSWVQRLDQGSQTAGDQQLYIYFVQNGKATELADVLNQVFGGRQPATRSAVSASIVAPGLEPVELSSPAAKPAAASTETGRAEEAARPGEVVPIPQTQATGPASSLLQQPGAHASVSQAIGLSTASEVRIVADEARNALLISGSPGDYRAVLRALRKLDRRPMEVLVEVTIADVILDDALEYGVRWYLQNASGKHIGGVSDVKADTLLGAVVPTIPGASYTFTSTNAKAVISLLSSVTDVEIISAPQILVLNNQEANLQVGDEVSVRTAETATNEGTVQSFEQRDSGVILKVTPRVNEGGLVIMDIAQEVSQVNLDSAAGALNPTISKRTISTTAAVQSGETVVLGGLIQDNKTNTKVGVPGLSAIPFLGALFRYTTDTVTRSELLVMVTPRVITNTREAQEITDELRRRMEDLERLEAKLEPKKKPEQEPETEAEGEQQTQ